MDIMRIGSPAIKIWKIVGRIADMKKILVYKQIIQNVLNPNV